MPTVEQLEKLIEEKLKAQVKVMAAVEKQQKLVKELAKVEKQYKPQEKSKKKEEATAYKNAKEAWEEAKTKLTSLEKSHEASEVAVSKLQSRLRPLTEFAQSRSDFLKWWEKEEGKIMTVVDFARDFAKDADDAGKRAEAAVKRNELEAARVAAKESAEAAQKATAKADAAAVLLKSWTTTWDAQRNLKSSHLDKTDVASYADVTKKVYQAFRTGQDLAAAAKRWGVEATQNATSAQEFADSGGDLVKTYGKLIDGATTTMNNLLIKITKRTTETWGKIVMEDSKQINTMRQRFEQNKVGLRDAAEKMVEQSVPLIEGVKAAITKETAAVNKLEQQARDRVPTEMQKRELRAKMIAMREVVLKADELEKTFNDKYEIAMTAIANLKQSVEA